MNATDELRRMLDERGVEWGSGFGGDTLWTGRDGIEWRWDKQENTLAMYSHAITPAQAIAATLGESMTDTEKAALERRIDELCSGNQRLLEEVMSLNAALEGMHIINDRYRADHAKLTELVKQMYPYAKAHLQLGVALGCNDTLSYDWALQMTELEIEVPE